MNRVLNQISVSSFLIVVLAALAVVAAPNSAQARQLQSDDLDLTTEEVANVEADSTAKLPKPPNARDLKLVGSFKPSFYWIAMEEHDSEARNQPLLDVNGDHLVSVTPSFLKKLKMEGTGKLLDGRMLNFKARLVLPDGTKEIRYRWCGKEAPYGFGWQDLPLVPFKSLAVDPTVIPIGSKVYVPAARGAVLPDGTIHDGMFTALDIGDAIQEKRIDVFTSFGDQSIVFGRVGMVHMKAVDVFLVR